MGAIISDVHRARVGWPAAPVDPDDMRAASERDACALLIRAVAAAHMHAYLDACAAEGITVVSYADDAEGATLPAARQRACFNLIVLRPRVVIVAGDAARALALHHEAQRRSVVTGALRVPVRIFPQVHCALHPPLRLV